MITDRFVKSLQNLHYTLYKGDLENASTWEMRTYPGSPWLHFDWELQTAVPDCFIWVLDVLADTLIDRRKPLFNTLSECGFRGNLWKESQNKQQQGHPSCSSVAHLGLYFATGRLVIPQQIPPTNDSTTAFVFGDAWYLFKGTTVGSHLAFWISQISPLSFYNRSKCFSLSLIWVCVLWPEGYIYLIIFTCIECVYVLNLFRHDSLYLLYTTAFYTNFISR